MLLAAAAAANVLCATTVVPANAAPLVVNGGFESGSSGWTRVDETGSEGTFTQQTGTTSPVTGETVPAPPAGTFAAMTDAMGPGSHVLYQDLVVPTGLVTSASFSADLFIGNRAPDFFAPGTLAFSTPALNQQARIDLLRAGADPFSLSAGDILANLFGTQPGDPLVTGYSPLTRDLTSLLALHAGQTVRLRFAEVDNVFAFQFGVDNVTLDATTTPVPEPTSLMLLGSGLAAVLARRRHR
jgi:hypothetical protein